jgi:hypothetical protein
VAVVLAIATGLLVGSVVSRILRALVEWRSGAPTSGPRYPRG